MAHVKAGSSAASQKANVVGKRRGLKVNQGEMVNGGQILVRQTGVIYHPGANVKLARDHSVISKIAGMVKFSYLRRPNGVKTVVNVYEASAFAKMNEVAPKAEVKAEVKEKAPKKVSKKKEVAAE